MANLIGVYNGTVTTGGTNGTRVSEDDSGSNAITLGPLRADLNATATQPLAIRCDTGYRTVSGEATTIKAVGPTAAKWRLSLDGTAWVAGSTGINVGQVGATNVLFYVEASATSDEAPQNDTTVDLEITAVIEAA